MTGTKKQNKAKSRNLNIGSTQKTLVSFYSSTRTTEGSTASAPTPNAVPSEPSSTHVFGRGSPDATSAAQLSDDAEDLLSPEPGPSILLRPHKTATGMKSIYDLPIPIISDEQRVKLTKQRKAEVAISGPLDAWSLAPTVALPTLAPGESRHPANTTKDSAIMLDSSPPRSTPPHPPPVNSGLFAPRAKPSVIVVNSSSPPPPTTPPNHKQRSRTTSSVIVIDESPTVSTVPHPFFRPRPKIKTIPSGSNAAGHTHETSIDLTSPSGSSVPLKKVPLLVTASAPWPGAFEQHIQPNRCASSGLSPCPFPRKQSRATTVLSAPHNAVDWVICMDQERTIFRQPNPFLQSSPIPHESLSHPAISRVDSIYLRGLSSPQNEVWIEKYRPSRACEVLGNEQNAQYIKNWLQALELTLHEPSNGLGDVPSKVSYGTLKRPRVVRTVERPAAVKKRRTKTRSDGYGDEDWIIDDDDDSDGRLESWDEVDDGDDEDRFLESLASAASRDTSPSKRRMPTPLPTPRHPIQPPSSARPIMQEELLPIFDFPHLTNALLIEGPTGCGKTAAVYACAAELGWSVFEVYPGTGKRGHARVMALLDAVGKNHTLKLGAKRQHNSSTNGKNESLNTMFFGALAKRRQQSNPGSDDIIGLDSDDSLVDIEGNEDESQTTKGSSKKVNQTIILLEEVDLLFQGESGFWNAVIDVIRESRRPVIMTCTDPTLVPRDLLPLQQTITFQSCPPSLVTSYLQRISKNEGCELPYHVLNQLYSPSPVNSPVDYPDMPLHPVPTGDFPSPDLRRALSQAQLLYAMPKLLEQPDLDLLDSEALSDWTSQLSSNAPQIIRKQQQVGRELDDLVSFSEYVSYANYLDRRLDDVLEATLNDEYETLADTELDFHSKVRPDEQLGHSILHKPIYRAEAPVIPLYARDEEIVLELITRSRHLYVSNNSIATDASHNPFSHTRLLKDRAAYQLRAVSFMEILVTLSSPLLPRPHIFLDYVPYVTAMVRADDEEERVERDQYENSMGRGRFTRNSMRGLGPPGVRYITLNKEQLDAVRDTALLVSQAATNNLTMT